MNKQAQITQMFDDIAKTYDPINRILSVRQDVLWRKKLSKLLASDKPLEILDVATGTGDVLFSMCEERANITKAIGVDVSANMLAVAQKKLQNSYLKSKISFLLQDATSLEFPDNSFDVVSIAFGIRNVVNKNKALEEFYRVLKPEGQLLVLEFSLPSNNYIKALYLSYFRYIFARIRWPDLWTKKSL
jgi:demethylmenaquinone methyltransferase/2-methoxy-6-polyprenyl-1,4-benzoquinol methylase